MPRLAGPAAGIDLGGTKIELIVLAPDGTTLRRQRAPTPRGDYAGTIRQVRAMVEGAEGELGIACTVGMGHPGSLSPVTALVRNANSVWLNDRPLGRDMEAAFGRPVALANDANCLALSEATDGAGADADAVFAVIAGTGIGGGLVLGGRVIAGANGIAGEWGHNPLPWPEADEWPGPRCWCGRDGCIEAWLSGPALARSAEASYGTAVEAPELDRRARAGDARAQALLDRHAARFAKASATVINLFDPAVVVLGGGVSNLEHLYAAVPPQWSRWVFADTVRTELRRAVHGDSSGVRGAAWLGAAQRLTRTPAA